MRLCCLLLSVSAFAAPHSSITIDRIARIKYPTDPIWSPDSKGIAFLWDAAGKQDLFLSQEGATALALTTFPVNPNMLQSDIGHVEWATEL
jgi:hypothetical protein